MTQAAKAGDKVKVHYTGKLENGEIFDSSVGADPLEFEVGSQQVIPGFDNGVIGMQPGDKKTVTITPEDGYGTRVEEMVMDMPRERFPEDITPEIGLCLQLVDDQEHVMPVMITGIKDDAITLDANHPLAGKTLVFDIELVEIA